MSAIAIFTCRPNSHPFQERHVAVQEPVKIGRSVARSRPMPNNAIFDCKVLSRNHALLWYDDGAFYLQDTKSSNGTFVNSQRLSKGSEESAPRQIYSGDIIQFGVDVMENSRRVTHSCIIATVQLFHPDGREATNDHSSPFLTSGGVFGAQSQELFQIAQYLQEALHREQMLENKLATLQRLVQQTQEASDSGWQALIDEDRLLSRLEVLENQLAAYSKNQAEDTLRQELTHLQEDKYNYETRAKESLHKVLQEKFEAVRKLSDLERTLSNTEDECSHLREMCEASQQELQALAEKHAEKLKEFSALQTELQEAEKKHNDTLEAAEQEKAELQRQLDEVTEEARHLQAKVEALQANNDFTKEQLANLKAKMEALRENNGDTPRICEHENKGIQVELVTLDLRLLNAKESDESESVSTDDEDDGDYKDRVKDILECLDESIEEKKNKEKDSSQDNGNISMEDLREKLKQTQTKMESYRNQLEQMSMKLKESHNNVEKLQGELEQARQELANKSKRIALLEEKIKESDDHMNNMIENAVTDLKNKVLDLEQQLSEVRSSANHSVIPLSSDSSGDQLNNTISLQDISPLQEEITKLKDLLSESNEVKSQMEAEINRYKSDLSTSREKLMLADNQVSSLRLLLEEAKKIEREKLEQNAKLRDQLFELEKSRKDVRQQMLSLQGQLREANLKEEQSHNEVEKLRLQVRSLQEELDYMQQMKGASDDREPYPHTSQTNYEFLSLKEECASLRKRIQDIEQEMGLSRREKLRLETDYYKLQESYHELEQLKDRLEDRELVWQLNLTDSQKESDQCKGEIKHFEASPALIAELREECLVLRDKIRKLEASHRQMEEEFDFLAYKSQMISACSIIPLIILFFGIVVAFHPFLSQITATATPGS